MKNWNYIEGAKVGNESIASHPESLVAQEIYKIYMDAGKDENKALETLSTKYKSIPKEALKKHLKDAIKAYASIVRNSKTGNGVWYGEAWNGDKFCYYKDKDDNTAEVSKKVDKNGNASWIVTFRSGKSSGYGRFIGEYSDFKKAKNVAEDKVHAARTGNETLHEYMTSKPRVINEDKTGIEPFFKKLAKDGKERAEKDDEDIEKVGNAKDKAGKELKVGDGVSIDTGDPKYNKGHIVSIDGDKLRVSVTGTGGSIWSTPAREVKKIGNKNPDWNVGNIDWDVGNFNGKWYITRNGQKLKGPFLSMKEAENYLDGHKWELQDKYGNTKTGNQSPQERLNQDLSIIKEECRKKGISLSFSELAKELEKYGWDFNELRKLKLPVSIGNSSSDDKFAYVMREFDEGKLKTPDGKVVTDPAQAKAIAYSESKKTENSLKRAFNALAKNKKVKNSAVREYKHSDGRVAQIDFNEDGSDADMSIYEDGNSNKELEHKNFSTIRDAEQYVTSHGFRRI